MRRHRRAQRSSRGDGKGLLISRRVVGTAPRAALVASGRDAPPSQLSRHTKRLPPLLHLCTRLRRSCTFALPSPDLFASLRPTGPRVNRSTRDGFLISRRAGLAVVKFQTQLTAAAHALARGDDGAVGVADDGIAT
jgi:hypothetical protein